MAVLKFLNQNGQWEMVETPGVIKYTEQQLTETQQAQVRANIGATTVTAAQGSGLVISNGQISLDPNTTFILDDND